MHKKINNSIINPIFIVGTVRSGSTLLASWLEEHPLIKYVGFELRKIWHEIANIDIAMAEKPQSFHCPPMNSKDVSNKDSEQIRLDFANYFIKEGGNRNTRFLNKNPHLSNKLPFVHKIFTDSYLIVISRPIKNTVASIKWLWDWIYIKFGVKHILPTNPSYCWSCSPPAPIENINKVRIFPGGDVSVIAEYWLNTYEKIENDCKIYKKTIPILYRDLINNQPEMVVKIQKLLDLPIHSFPLPEIKREQSKNKTLSSNEEEKIDLFIKTNQKRIRKLKFVDTFEKLYFP